MAEIEFKRRGTPLWAVVLALAVIGVALWLIFGRGDAAGPAATDPAAPGQAAPAPGTPGSPSTPSTGAAPSPPGAAAPTGGAVGAFAAFVAEQRTPAGTEVGPYVGEGLQRLAAALQERYPTAGVQVVLIRAMSDSLRLPGLAPERQTDMAQAAFFAAGFAMGRAGPGGNVGAAASQIELRRPLARQLPAVRSAFTAARDALQTPAGADSTAAARKS
jgi:hypothetical protein